jgi:cytochrome c oxidase subunit I
MQTITHTEFVARPSAEESGKRAWIFQRPVALTGLVSWLTTVDHKRIGILYGISGLFFFLVGGVEALLIRTQLAQPNNTLLSHQVFNELFTMHGSTMIFLAIMPLGTAAFNYIMPLQIGARDVAFPRLNAFAYWTFLAGAIILNLGWFVRSGSPDIGWYGYAPLTSRAFSNEFAADASTNYWILGLQILGVSSVMGSLNFIVTIINCRAPGLTAMRMPVFTWMTLVTSFLVILAFPAITIALVELMMDRYFNTNFFEVSNGGMPIIWQHLFWIFGHPEVYILILPAMGVISEVIPTFARKPLFGYPIVVFSGACIGFLGFGVWGHHMFVTGLGNVGNAAFALATMTIAVPTGVKIFNWVGTLWGGHIRMRTPMLFALGFIWMFMIGGFSGVMHSAAPADAQQNDTYFVVAHFHYVLIGGTLFALLAGIPYWLPLICGKQMSDRGGKLAFWLIFAGFNVTFFPMHFLGLNGMPRRVAVYDGNMGLTAPNLISTIGAYILGVGIATYIGVLIYTLLKGEKTKDDPWDGRTLEWLAPTPPPVHNFDVIPSVHARDELWYRKHHLEKEALASEKKAREDLAHHGIHMPSQSWFPLVAAIGLLVGGISASHHHLYGSLAGALILFLGVWLWSLEGPGGYYLVPTNRSQSPENH